MCLVDLYVFVGLTNVPGVDWDGARFSTLFAHRFLDSFLTDFGSIFDHFFNDFSMIFHHFFETCFWLIFQGFRIDF